MDSGNDFPLLDRALSASPDVLICPTCSTPSSARNLVVCIDGTSNQFSNTNVVELYSRLVKDGTQATFYNSGIGTYAKPYGLTLRQWIANQMDLAFAWRFDKILLSAYRWLSDNYQEGDRIFLFGFSRGAYQVRARSAMINDVGLIHKGNEDQIALLFGPARSQHEPPPVDMAARFKRTFSRKNVTIHFVGAWDTVSSVGIFRDKPLPGTMTGMGHVCHFRHALAIHERRVKFLPEFVGGSEGPPPNDANAFPLADYRPSHTAPRVKEVWFAGSHGNIFGPSLRWMSYEARLAGLHLDDDVPSIWFEEQRPSESLTALWWLLEVFPIRRLDYEAQPRQRHRQLVEVATTLW
ncbi:hypothetical protein EXIGLDRAFT_623373 [Exidia glandulosa HHB12029]|uniref:T6SS Phospholipase effector Tle1-like catalytic domain-containing protein n=1 Tax=Exidia glandulosa HHB12029 TaxID=1314781 RepID=A0A165DQQ0_EXIGL|nr:hypothetical protein EXIGLDRAFT_623373 [Exidia glandulosa HHB12029]